MVLLFFPPFADPTQPYASLPTLTAFLRSHGWEVSQIDLNIEFTLFMCTRERLRQALGRIETRLNQLNVKRTLSEGEAVEYDLLVKAALKAPLVIPEVAGAIKRIRERECFENLAALHETKRTIHEALEILAAGWFPHRFSLVRPTSLACDTPAEIMRWAQDREVNPYNDFYVTQLLPRLENTNPQAIGISLTYLSQIIPAVTLAALLKGLMPKVPIIFGGNIISTWYDSLEECPELFNWCDYLIAFEGESALHRLLLTLSQGGDLSEVPNLIYHSQGKVLKNPVGLEELNQLPTPDYQGLPFDKYLAPEIVFSLYSTRGCYWSKCHFCAVSPAMRQGHRERSPAKIHEDLVNLQQRYRARLIFFVDDCLAPATLSAISTLLIEKGPEVYWQGEVRFEPALTGKLLQKMRKAGCLNLIFGLESYSPRVLSLMHKGTDRKNIDRIIHDCRRIGIAFNLQFFFGFPGESLEEAELTAQFIQGQAHGAATFSFGTFELQRGSNVERNPGKFWIDYVDRKSGPLAVKFAYKPRADYAEMIKRSLRAELLKRTPYPYAGLSINAHCLIFLELAGPAALGNLYQKKIAGTKSGNLSFSNDIMHFPLVLPEKQTVGTFAHRPGELEQSSAASPSGNEVILLYNHLGDKIVEVSPIIMWLLKGLDGKATPMQLATAVQRMCVKSEPPIGDSNNLLDLMEKSIQDLYHKGFLVQSEF